MATAISRKAEISEQVVDYVFEHGVSDLSLRPLAESLGTSARMLLYHFESKEQLVAEVLRAARMRQYHMMRGWADEGASFPEVIRRYWEWAAAETSRPYMHLFFEAFGLAVQRRPGTEGILEDLGTRIVGFLQPSAEAAGLDPRAANELVRLATGVLRGLLFDLLATDDRAPLDAALERFLAFVEQEMTNSQGGKR